MRFLIDMPLSNELAAWLRGQGHDAVHAAELNLAAAPDIVILAHARQQARTIVTAASRAFLRLRRSKTLA